MRMAPLLRAKVIVVALLGASCTPSYVVVSASGGDMATVNRGGLTLNAVPNAWDDDPSDLNQYMTPIWVQLKNHGKQDVRVVYADFALISRSGFRYAAISPYPNQGSVSGSPAPAAVPPPKKDATGAARETSEWYFDKGALEQERAEFVPLGDGTATAELVRFGGRMGGGRMGGGHLGGGHLGGGRMGAGRMGAGHVGGSHVGGFGHIGPHYGSGFYGRPYYYGYYSPWPFFYAWPPYYGPYVYYWGPRYYPVAPSEAVMQRGLPEGVLHAGGNVSGFVYFQHASSEPTSLDLNWTPQAVDGKRLVTLHVPLTVIED